MLDKKYEIMIIDDEVVNISVLSEVLKPLYIVSVFKSGIEALKQIELGMIPDLILLDLNIPDINGYDLLKRLTPECQVMILTGLNSVSDEEKGLSSGAIDYISKPFHAQIVLARVKLQLELKDARDRLKVENTYLEKEVKKRFRENQLIFDITMDIVTQLVETRDEETAHHITRSRAYMEVLTRRLAMNPKYSALIDEAYIERLIKACPLHDIGKVGISDQILLKPGILTTEEYDLMKEHVMIGYRSIQRAIDNSILKDLLNSTGDSLPMEFFTEAMSIVRSHHEHYDGSGYPDGLKGEDIPLSARIMALIDVFDALTNHRVYKPAWSIEKAIEYIEMQSGYQFDPDVVDAMLSELESFKDIYHRISA